MKSMRHRLSSLLLNVGMILIWGLGLAAAGLLPRLEYARLSNLATGYTSTGEQQSFGGFTPSEWLVAMLQPGDWYVGGSVMILLCLAPLLVKYRYATPFWSMLATSAAILSSPTHTPLHETLYTLAPGLSKIHPHHPERISQLFYLSAALLAGATVTRLAGRISIRTGVTLLLIGLALAATPRTLLLEASWLILTLCLFSVCLVGAALLCLRNKVQTISVLSALMLVLIFIDLFTAAQVGIARGLTSSGYHPFRYEPLIKLRLREYYKPTATSTFLRSRTAHERARYFGFDPGIRVRDILYRYQFKDRKTSDLLVNNRATILGLDDIQGYNPIHIRRYDEYLTALNGRPQEYRAAHLLEGSIDSPLLELLSARYMVVPANSSQVTKELGDLPDTFRLAYEDAQVRVFERPSALPRAWLVHEAQVVRRGEALSLLSSRAIDPKRTALLEQPPPRMSAPTDGAADLAQILEHSPDRIRLSTRSSAPSMLMLSEIYYPAWKAYVDGKPAELYVADHILRAVGVPTGEHEVELRYESWTLRVGLVISGLTYAGLITLLIVLLLQTFRCRRQEGRTQTATFANGNPQTELDRGA